MITGELGGGYALITLEKIISQRIKEEIMKKVILTTLALVLAVSTVLSVTGFALAQNERVPGEEAVAVRMGLVIRAPLVAKAGEPLRIQIVTRPGERPVPDAEVWAVNIDNNPSDVVLTADVASLSQCNAIRLGTTNDRGYIDPPPRIWEKGKYLLVAIKPNYAPGFAMMKITSRVPLTLRAPDTARVGQVVPMSVTDPSGQGVGRVAIFAIPLLSITQDGTISGDYDGWLKSAEAYAEMLENPSPTTDSSIMPEAYNEISRYFIGFTDRSGNISHRFSQAGPYLIIAAKCGYTPDFHIIKITRLQKETTEQAPMRLEKAEVSLKEFTLNK